MTLTPEGRSLLDEAQALLDRAHVLEHRFSAPDTFDGELRIGTTDTFASVHLFTVAKSLREAFPGARVRFETQESATLIARVAKHELDAAFVEIEPSDTAVCAELFREDPLMVATSPDRPPEPIGADDTVIVFPTGCSYRAGLVSWYESQGLRPALEVEFRGINAVLGSVSAGIGVTAVPEYVAQSSRFDIALQEFPRPVSPARTWWIYSRDADGDPVIRRLCRVVSELAKSGT